MVMVQMPQGAGPALQCQVRLKPVVPGGYRWTLTGTVTYSEPGFAYLVVDADPQSNIEGLEQKILHHFGPRHISSDQEAHFTAHKCPTMGKEMSSFK